MYSPHCGLLARKTIRWECRGQQVCMLASSHFLNVTAWTCWSKDSRSFKQCVELLVLSNVRLHVRFQLFVYVCRAIIIRNNEIIPMSTEFTPESERQRLQFLVRKIYVNISYRVSKYPSPGPKYLNSVYSVDRRNSARCLRQFLTVLSHNKQHNQQDIWSPPTCPMEPCDSSTSMSAENSWLWLTFL